MSDSDYETVSLRFVRAVCVNCVMIRGKQREALAESLADNVALEHTKLEKRATRTLERKTGASRHCTGFHGTPFEFNFRILFDADGRTDGRMG